MPITHNENTPFTTSTSTSTSTATPRYNNTNYSVFDQVFITVCIFILSGVLVYSLIRFIVYVKIGPNMQRWENNQELNFPIVPIYTPRATQLDLGTFDKNCNLIPTRHVSGATIDEIIYNSDDDLIPYPEAVHIRERSNSLPSYKSFNIV